MDASSNYDFNESFEQAGYENSIPDLPSPDLLPNLELGQCFTSPLPNLWRVEVLLGTHQRMNPCKLFFALREGGPRGKVIALTSIPGDQVEDNEWHSLEFGPIAGSAGRTYYLAAYCADSREGSALVWWMSMKTSLESGGVLFNGREGEQALCLRTFHMTSPVIWKNLDALKAQYKAPATHLPFSPVRLVLELTTRCNLRCRMCRDWQDYALKHKSDGDLPDELFTAILNLVRRAVIIQPQGWGEPLVHPRFFQYMEKIREVNPGGVISFNTNGMLLGPEAAEKTVELGINRVCVSLDSARKDVFEAIRKGASLERILGNLTHLLKIRAKAGQGRPALATHMVLMAETIEELPDFFRMCHEAGFEEISLGTLYGCEELQVRDFSKYLDLYLEARTYAYQRNLKIYGTGVDKFESLLKAEADPAKPEGDHPLHFPLCCDPWETVFYEFTGNIRPCCNYLGLPVYGNTRESLAVAIWNTRDYQRLRSDFLSRRPIAHCRHCMETLFAAGRSVIRSRRIFSMTTEQIDQRNPLGRSGYSRLKYRFRSALQRFESRGGGEDGLANQ